MKSKVLLFSFLFTILISQQINAQCSVTTTIDASELTCGAAPLDSCSILYIGDGTTPMTLTMNDALDLACLGPIQLIVRNNATLDFTAGNDYLTLEAGSSLIFQPGAGLNGQSCNASERIYIGGVLIASCNGSAGAEYSFAELLAQGGFNIVTPMTSPTAVCGSGSFNLTANPAPSVGAEVSWYDAPVGGNLLNPLPSNTYATGVISATTIYYAQAYYPSSGFTTPRASVTTAVSPPSVWNGASWSTPPTAVSSLIFNGNYSSTGNLSGCTCTVNNGSVVFNAGHTLNLSNELNVAGGTVTFNNTASLVQVNNTTNTGSITYIRNTTPVINLDYTYWSSPTTGSQTLLNFSPNTTTWRFFTYHNIWQYSNSSVDTFSKGIGYAIWVPQGTSPSVPTILPHQFLGVPNNGDVDVAVSLAAQPISNILIGNPYPSTLDANAFIDANIVGTGTINQTISGTLYFWTHNHTLSGNNYLQSDYATYTKAGGTAVSTGTGNTTAPTQYITAGQGFFVNQVANGNVSFRNNMRLGANNTNFYKTSNAKTSEKTSEKHRIWLNLTNKKFFSQALVGYVEEATNDYNSGFDGLYYGTNEFAIYSLIKNDAFAIQARALPFSNVDAVPIGFITNISGDLSIGIDHLDGLFLDGQKIYLEDKLLKTINDITDVPYQFTANKGTTNDRFVLRYTNKTANNAGFNLNENVITVFVSNHELKINSSLESIKNYTIYNVLGQALVTKNNVNTNQSVVNSIIENNQALIVKIVLNNGQTVTKKIIF